MAEDNLEDGADSDYTRRGQQWIQNNFVRQLGRSAFIPDSEPGKLEQGWKLSDLKKAYDGAIKGRMATDRLVKLGNRHARLADLKEERGLDQTAIEFYHRAALCYSQAQWSIWNATDPDKLAWHEKALAAYGKVMELDPGYDIEKVDIESPHHDAAIAALFHKCGKSNVPTVLYVPGMDVAKEDGPNPLNNRFVERGMNVLVIDGPGQGETRLRGVCDDDYETYQKAGRVAIDWLVERPEVDESRIGVFGHSMGSYWAPRVVYEDDRVSALAVEAGLWYSKDEIFNQAPPNFKERFMYMAGFEDEREFDEYAKGMTLDGIDEEIDVPTFIGHGEYDGLQSREAGKRFYNRLTGPKELHLYKNQEHALGGVPAERRSTRTDWFVRVWNGDIDADHEKAILVPDYPREDHIASTRFESFFDSVGVD